MILFANGGSGIIKKPLLHRSLSADHVQGGFTMSYVDEILEKVIAQNPAQPEFHQAVKEVLESLRVVIEANEDKFRKERARYRSTMVSVYSSTARSDLTRAAFVSTLP